MSRDNEYRCVYCGKYIAYKDIPENVEQSYTPDSEYSHESYQMWHKKCNLKENRE